jgi:hypothetical protein
MLNEVLLPSLKKLFISIKGAGFSFIWQAVNEIIERITSESFFIIVIFNKEN